ncbi:LysR family transcriptional regulator [Rhodococcus fascians]|nr:LysR family transcriptional regulator [Rhodococcus fascians]MBY4237421.1 LysR family transcriptional regulator [Rhodococcus fascians]MBY4253100.1 LysR family transcriptional regulator [Rhodococcus fascians]MBY4268660.1 LysR family transcriptional regulator [Rhodococcus fascians]
MNVTTAMLECFVAIVDEHGLGNAARALGVSQPTVSGTVRSLETELGVELFRREANTLVLTPEGTALLAVARRTVLDHRAVERLIDGLRGARSATATEIVRIGISDDSMSPESMATLVAARSGTRIDIVSIPDPVQALAQVRAGLIEFAVVTYCDAVQDFAFEVISNDVLVLALPPALGRVDTFDQLALAGPVSTLTQSADGADVVAVLSGCGIVAELVLTGVPSVALPGLVARGLGAAVMAESTVWPVAAAGGSVLALTPPVVVHTVLAYSSDCVAPLTNSFVERLVGVRRRGTQPDNS